MPRHCDHPKKIGDPDLTTLPSWLHQNRDHYTPRHNPFVYFRSLIGKGDAPHSVVCDQNDVPLEDADHHGLQYDLEHNDIPSFVFISPDLCHDGHSYCSSAKPGGANEIRASEMESIDSFLDKWGPVIQNSAAYKDGGLIIITFDEAEVPKHLAPRDEPGDDAEVDDTWDLSCCAEKPGPGWKHPGLEGPGGGRVGAILISPYIKPHSPDNNNEYNHYSMLRSIEDFFDLDHLGYAAQGGLNTFQACGVFNNPNP